MLYRSQPKGDNDHDPDMAALDVKPSQTILNSCNETIINFHPLLMRAELQI